MKEFMFKPHYLRFKAWIWAFSSNEQILAGYFTGADMAAKPLRLADGVFEEQSAAYCLYYGDGAIEILIFDYEICSSMGTASMTCKSYAVLYKQWMYQ
ncbi:hypothetical protein L1987_66508 [Smallanthus sonchifolius]|uniref:Uncharacterized protein n=1 Tax=Smallanthus sonchifolius TaxID=185202 RepID=A0ACB9BXB7_9ASTR|nr:hypothetical protein L1987_66508 [Smallanthus sonchifolius]